MKQFKPLGNRVLIERSKAQATKGGILLPDSAQEKPKEGTVIAVGPGKIDDEGKTIAMNVKKGDKVLFSTYSGTEVSSTGDDVQYLIIAEDDLLGVIEN
jgi:chaperonin GroES